MGEEGGGEGEGGVCGVVGEMGGEGKGGVFGVVGEMSVCGVDGGWVGGGGGGGGKWRVPSLSCRVVPVCVWGGGGGGGDGGEDGERWCKCLHVCLCWCMFGFGPLVLRHGFGVSLLSGANFPKTLVCVCGLILGVPKCF